MRFVPDQRDPPLKAFSTQGLRGRKARHTIADDRYMRRHHFTSPASRSTCTSPPSTLMGNTLIGLQAGSAFTFPVRTQNLPKCSVHSTTPPRSEEHTSELQSLMRISYAVFC